MPKINFLIVHYNTPLLTECLVKSVNKFTPDSKIYVFDNSDKEPFVYRCGNLEYIDNTDGQIINFDKWLQNYPSRLRSPGKLNKWGSAKHCYSVEKFMEMNNEPFILLDSDVLLLGDVSDLFDLSCAYVGEVIVQPRSAIKRVLPYICFINTKLCKENGAHYFNDKRMHGLGGSGDRFDTGASFYLDCAKLKHREIKSERYVTHYSGGSWIKEKETIRSKHEYTPEEWLNRYKKMWGEVGNNKNVVYTCITGGYDNLLANIKVEQNFDYVCFTDDENLNGGGIWEIRKMPEEVKNLSKVKQQRYVKINAHKVLPEYDLSLWVDGVVEIRGDINKFIKVECDTDDVVFIPQHPQRKCIYREAEICKRMKKDVAANIDPQMERYKKEGFPSDYGLVQTNIMLRKHNDPVCVKLMEDWWAELSVGSHRDQLSFNYALWKNNGEKFKYLPKTTYKSDYFNWLSTMHVKKGGITTVRRAITVAQSPLSTQPIISDNDTIKTDASILLDNSTLMSAELKTKPKYKPMIKKTIGHPKTKSMKSLLSVF